MGNRFFHWNPSLIKQLAHLKPSVVITCGFDLSMLQGFFWSRIERVPHISFSDGTLDSEGSIGLVRRFVRRVVIRNSRALVGASRKTLLLFQKYGAPSHDCFQSCLCVDNSRYANDGFEKSFDLLYVSQLIHRKMPDLIIDIMHFLGRDYSLQVVGDGQLRDWFTGALASGRVNYNYAGFVEPNEMPSFYKKARLFLFPTRSDAWGVVANEACAAGVPVMTTPSAGAAGELIVHGENGFVLAPTAEIWANHIRLLLEDKELYTKMSRGAVARVRDYNYENAVQGISDSIERALKQ